MEHFDNGGQGVSYLDSTPGNIGILYRMSDNADVDVAWDNKGSFVIGWTKAGEWLEYTVNVASTDIYTLSTWVGAPATGGIFHWEIDGLDVTGALAVPNTGGYYNYQAVSKNGVAMNGGRHVFRLSLDTEGSWGSVGNFNLFALQNSITKPQIDAELYVRSPVFPTRVDLNWPKVADNEKGYLLERRILPGGNFSTIKTLLPDTEEYSDTGLTPGQQYEYRLTAFNDSGTSTRSAVNSLTTPTSLNFPYKINFQAAYGPPVAGYKVDVGEFYGSRGDGLTYGWSADATTLARKRGIANDPLNPELAKLHDTLVHFPAGAIWKMALPQGDYDVTVGIGDPTFYSTYTLNVNGVNYWDYVALNANQYDQKMMTVSVGADGLLTLDQGTLWHKATRIDYIEVSPSSGTALPAVSVQTPGADITEGNTTQGTFVITRTGDTTQSLTVGYSLSGSASTSDYTPALSGSITFGVLESRSTLSVTAADDTDIEADEFLRLTLNPSGTYNLGSPRFGEITIHDNDATAGNTVSITLLDPDASETGNNSGTFRISRNDTNSGSLTVSLRVSGNAISGNDHFETIPTSIDIPAVPGHRDITVTPIDDTEIEGPEQVTIQLVAPANYTVEGQNPRSLTIADNDGNSQIELTATPVSTERIEYFWTPISDADSYRLEISGDGSDFYDSETLDASSTIASGVGFFPAQTFSFRVIAVRGGVDLATSNVATATTFSSGAGSSAAAEQPGESEAAAAPDKWVVAFNGLYVRDPLDSDGNKWFEHMIREDGDSIKPIIPDNRQTYRSDTEDIQLALDNLIQRLDTDGNQVISAAEATARPIVVAGYSWGGINAANFTIRLKEDDFVIGNKGYHLSVDIPVSLLVTLDPIHSGPSRAVRWVHGKIDTNVNRFINYYERRGGSVAFDLWLHTANQNFSPATKIPFDDAHGEFGAQLSFLLRGNTLPNKLAAANVKQVNITTLGARLASNFQWSSNPLNEFVNQYDTDLGAGGIEHTGLPWYVRGGTNANFPTDYNILWEFAHV